MKWSEPQEAAITLRNENILVSAAAGSGKTAVLIERIKQLIVQDEVGINEMLVVTFSSAAASEMRQRLILALTAEIEKSGSNQGFLQDQLNGISRANISTFHAFALEIIRRYFYLIDMEPHFRLCDEPYKVILQSEAMDQLMDELFLSKDAEFLGFLTKYASSKNENEVRAMIMEVHRFVQSMPNSFSWLADQIDVLSWDQDTFIKGPIFALLTREIAADLERAENYFQRVQKLMADAGLTRLGVKCRSDLAALQSLSASFKNKSFDEFSREARRVKFETLRTVKDEEPQYLAIREQVKVFRDQGKTVLKGLITQYLGTSLSDMVYQQQKTYEEALVLNKMVLAFDRLYSLKKKEKGIIDFNDIEHYALKILSFKTAAEEYKAKFRHIFIDEYQDSNLVQETLISRIKRENNLFMVGDVKQSIYKFRLAEPEIFMAKYDSFREPGSGEGVKLDLNLNYRSKLPIIKVINSLFSQLMQKDTGGITYDDAAALHEGVPYEGDLAYPVALYLAENRQLEDENEDPEINEMKTAEVEAKVAVKIIKDCLGKAIYDEKSGRERRVSLKDIVILFRSAKGYADIYSEILMQEDLPNFVDIGEGYFDTMEIAVFLNLLSIIDNKKQDIPLLSTLRSPIFGFTTVELSRIRLTQAQGSYHRAFEGFATVAASGQAERPPDLEELAAKCRKTLDCIARWKAAAAFMTLEALLWLLIRETGYEDYIAALPGGSQRRANLRALIDKASQYQNTHMKGLFGFINYIEQIKKDKVSTSQVSMISENDDVVRIMTVHKSKGLEFPIVLVCGLGKKFNRDTASYRVTLHKQIGIGLRYVDIENGCYAKTLIQTLIEQQRLKEATAEEIRILYVALTRAKDRLILLGSVKDAQKTLMKLAFRDSGDFSKINNALEWILLAQKNEPMAISIVDRNELGLSRKTAAANRSYIKETLLEGFPQPEDAQMAVLVAEKLSWQYAHSPMLTVPSKMSVSEVMKPRTISSGLTAVPKFKERDQHFTSAERGTFVHRILERMSFGKGTDEETVKRHIADMVQHEMLTKEQAGSVDVRLLMNFFKSDIGRRAAKAERIYKEVPFNLIADMANLPGMPKSQTKEDIILQGTIDCYFEEDGQFILLDYKTDYLKKDYTEDQIMQLVAQYKPQLGLYKEALEKIRGIAMQEAYLFFLSVGREIRIDFD